MRDLIAEVAIKALRYPFDRSLSVDGELIGHISRAYEIYDEGKSDEVSFGPLKSLLQQIHLSGKYKNIDSQKYYKSQENLFQLETMASILTEPDGFSLSKERLNEIFKAVDDCQDSLKVEYAMGLMNRYLSLVSMGEENDVSCFDVALMASAISCASYGFSACDDNQKLDQEKEFALVSGDLSGIQDFILDLPHQQGKGIAKILRARSFYLSILCRVAGNLILNKLNLPVCCRILDAGGRFVLLVPNTKDSFDILSKAREQIDIWMMKTFQGKISLNISEMLQVGDKELKHSYKSVAQKLRYFTDNAKKTKFKYGLQSKGQWLESEFIFNNLNDLGNYKENLNSQFREIGRVLPRVNGLLFCKSNGQIDGNKEEIDVLNFFDEIKLRMIEGPVSESLPNNDVLHAYAVNAMECPIGFVQNVHFCLRNGKLEKKMVRYFVAQR